MALIETSPSKPINVNNTHLMQTHSKSTIIKPKSFLSYLLLFSIPFKPYTFVEASKFP